jgi:hypothetical protein
MKAMNPTECEAQYADATAREALDSARTVLERTLIELDRTIARYEKAESLKDKADVINWTINHLTMYTPGNLRLGLLANAQAALARAEARR